MSTPDEPQNPDDPQGQPAQPQEPSTPQTPPPADPFGAPPVPPAAPSPYGSPQYGQPPQQPQYGEPQYGSPQYGQPQYGAAPQYGASPYQPGYAAGPPPNNYLVWAILTTILCCLPLGIVSIVFSSQVNTKWAQGDFEGAQKSSIRARQFAMWSAIALGVGVVLYFILVAIIVAAGGSMDSTY